MTRSTRILFFFFFLLSLSGFTQQNGLGNSPYSQYGLGDLIWSGPTRNMGMGGAGVASPGEKFVNILNPSLLVYSKAASFEMAALGQYKVVQSADEWQTATGGSIHYGAFALPLHRRWTASLGLHPVTEISYERRYSGQVVGDTSTNYLVQEFGDGGLNKAFFGNGFRITKNFALGVEGSYFFGNKDQLSRVTLDIPGSTVEGIQDFYYFRSLDLKFGAYWSSKLDSSRNINLGLGGTYNFTSTLRTELLSTKEIPFAGNNSATTDTLKQGSVEVVVPEEIRVGFSIYKPGKWSINADLSYIPWESFVFEGENTNLRNSMNFFVGGEFAPNPGSVSNIFTRTFYRVGAFYRQPPYPYNENFIEDFGINFGLSLPITKFAFLNFAATIGQRGTTDFGLIKENYNRFSIGLVINDANWFKRLKLE